jgi:hypothetical protein
MNDRLPFERRFPGTWINLSDQHAAFEIRAQLHTVTSVFDEATMALILFERAQREEAHAPSRDECEGDSHRRAEISRMLEQLSPDDRLMAPCVRWPVCKRNESLCARDGNAA